MNDFSFTHILVQAIVTSPALPHTMFLSRKLYNSWLPPQYSLDGGETWRDVAATPWSNTGLTNMYIGMAPRSDGSARILVAVNGSTSGLYRSGDLGQTWSVQDTPGVGEINTLAGSIADPARLYLTKYLISSGDPFTGPTIVSYLDTSSDSGVTWSEIGMATLDNYFDAIVPSPVKTNLLYLHQLGYDDRWGQMGSAGQTGGPVHFQRGQLSTDGVDPLWLYSMSNGNGSFNGYSSDAGVTWTNWLTSPCKFANLIAHPTKAHTIYLNCEDVQGMFRSKDGGQHWDSIAPTSVDLIAPDYSVNGRLLMTKGITILASCDDGTTWIQPTTGCP